jgi:hypothetical protein
LIFSHSAFELHGHENEIQSRLRCHRCLFIFIVRIIPLSEGWRDEESKEFVTRHLARQLDLTDEQVEQVKPVVAEVLEARYRHRRTYVEADIELTGTGFEKILPVLTEEQKERAKEVFANWKKGKERFTRTRAAE